jgi:hypothetical protein
MRENPFAGRAFSRPQEEGVMRGETLDRKVLTAAHRIELADAEAVELLQDPVLKAQAELLAREGIQDPDLLLEEAELKLGRNSETKSTIVLFTRA